MEKWQKDFWEMMETVANEVDRFLYGMTEMVDSFLEITEEISEEIQNSIAAEVEHYLDELSQELSEPFFDVYSELEDYIGEDIDPGFPYSVPPSPEENAACIGCRHYHGQVYNGNLLVCGMHPYGWEEENCPDWEQEEF
jgi:hypothetical protein